VTIADTKHMRVFPGEARLKVWSVDTYSFSPIDPNYAHHRRPRNNAQAAVQSMYHTHRPLSSMHTLK